MCLVAKLLHSLSLRPAFFFIVPCCACVKQGKEITSVVQRKSGQTKLNLVSAKLNLVSVLEFFGEHSQELS